MTLLSDGCYAANASTLRIIASYLITDWLIFYDKSSVFHVWATWMFAFINLRVCIFSLFRSGHSSWLIYGIFLRLFEIPIYTFIVIFVFVKFQKSWWKNNGNLFVKKLSIFMWMCSLVVIATQFSETKKREMERMRQERARYTSTSTITSSTNNSEPSTCYAEIVKYIAHLWRRLKRRLIKKLRTYKYE